MAVVVASTNRQDDSRLAGEPNSEEFSAMSVSRVLEELFPLVHYLLRTRRLRRRSESCRILDEQSFARYTDLSVEDLTDRLAGERTRAQVMDEKTFKLTLALSIGFAFVGLASTPTAMSLANEIVRMVVVASTGIGLGFVLLAGFVALGALRTLPSYGYGTAFLLESRQPKDRYVAALATALARQETMNAIRHLRNETAYQCLRNGFVFFFVAFACRYVGLFVGAVSAA